VRSSARDQVRFSNIHSVLNDEPISVCLQLLPMRLYLSTSPALAQLVRPRGPRLFPTHIRNGVVKLAPHHSQTGFQSSTNNERSGHLVWCLKSARLPVLSGLSPCVRG